MSIIPSTLTRQFQEYRVEDLDVERHAGLILARAPGFGSRADLRWIFFAYGTERVRDFVRRRGFRKLSRRAFGFWRTVLGVTEYVTPPWLTERSPVWRF